MNFTTWITVLAVGGLAVVSPGPNLAIIIKNSLISRKYGFSTAYGVIMGSLTHISYCLIGITVIISNSILLFNILKWFGAIYFLYIGAKSLQAKKQTDETLPLSKNKHIAFWKAFRTGFLTDLLNPKVTLFFLALFTQTTRLNTPVIAQAIYGLTVVMIEIIWYSFMVVFLTQVTIRKNFLSISHWVERLTGVLFITLALQLVFMNS